MHTTRHHRLPLLAGLFLVASACSTGPELDFTLHETDRGTVYLERISDRSLHAAHPIRVSADTMARVLRGVYIKENRGFLVNAIGGKQEPVRVLKDEDVEFLAPLLVEGLARAASDQQVGFRFGRTGRPGEWKQGSLYAYGQSLYLTLPWLIPVDRLGAGGPTLSPTILFIPESARRPDSSRDARSTESTVVIDYALLAALPATPSVPVKASEQTGASDRELQQIKGDINKKNVEIEALRKEMESIRRELETRSGEQETPSRKTKPVQKTQPPAQ